MSLSCFDSEYLWKDNANYKKPTRVPAPVYIDLLLNWVSDQISDPALFPVEEGAHCAILFFRQQIDQLLCRRQVPAQLHDASQADLQAVVPSVCSHLLAGWYCSLRSCNSIPNRSRSQHFQKMKAIGATAHLNTCFKHFIYFVLEFQLIPKQGMAPMEKFISKFRDGPASGASGASAAASSS